MSESVINLYQDVILDHSKKPRNFGKLKSTTHYARVNNPLCGDKVTVYLKIEGKYILDATFEARGCAISLASASMMSEMIKGKKINEAIALFRKFYSLITTEQNVKNDGLGDLKALSGVKNFPTRVECATLSWKAMEKAVEEIGY